MKLKNKKTLVHSILSLLLMISPIIATKQACLSFWGEPEIPEFLRN